MNIKNLIIYEIKDNSNIDLITEELLNKLAYTPCGDYDSSKQGFISPYGNDKLILQVKDQMLLTVQHETKIIPPSAINKALQERIANYEKVVGKKPIKTERLTLKDEVMFDLLPRAFSRFTPVNIWINKRDKYLAVCTSSFKKAEDCLAILRRELGTLAVTPFWFSETPLAPILTGWVMEGFPLGIFILGNDIALQDNLLVTNKVKIVNEDLDSSDVKTIIDGGKEVTSLSLVHDNLVNFAINSNDTITKIKIDSSVFDNVEYDPAEEHELMLEANFAITTGVLSNLIDDLKRAIRG